MEILKQGFQAIRGCFNHLAGDAREIIVIGGCGYGVKY